MKILVEASLSLTHRHLDAEIGPASRPHEHQVLLRVEIDDLGFDPSLGRIVDPKAGPVSVSYYTGWLQTQAAIYHGRALEDIPGIRPTMESLVRSIRERLILFWPEARVSLACLEEGWEVWA